MVNFRQKIEKDMITEWKDHYIDYENLHTILDSVEVKITAEQISKSYENIIEFIPLLHLFPFKTPIIYTSFFIFTSFIMFIYILFFSIICTFYDVLIIFVRYYFY